MTPFITSSLRPGPAPWPGRRLLLLITLALVGPLIDSIRAAPPGEIHHPDLWSYYPYNLTIEGGSSTRAVRFSIAIANFGRGPLEVVGHNDPARGTTDAYHRLFTHDGAGAWQVAEERHVGTFEFHDDHDHWHFEAFAAYELRDTAPDGSPGPNVLARSPKVSFCLRDSWQATSGIEHAMPQTYLDCTADRPQGIAVGWADIYPWDLPGQSLPIAGLRDGNYWLLVTADPDNLLDEGVGEGNNRNGTKFQLSKGGRRVRVLRYGL